MMNLNVLSKFIIPCSLLCVFVRVIGIEPTCLAASDPKSDTSTNFATPAYLIPLRKFCFRKEILIPCFGAAKLRVWKFAQQYLNKVVYD